MSPIPHCLVLYRPTLHHFGVVTRRLQEMVEWYANVLGMVSNYSTSHPLGSAFGLTVCANFVSNDRANHRIGIFSVAELKDDPDKHGHTKLQHVAFEYPTIDEFLTSYARIKDLGIEPVYTIDHGPTTSFYYEDPDGNSVELFVDNFGNWDTSTEYVRISPDFGSNSLGTPVDPDKLVAARQAGMSLAELHRRAYAGEFPPTGPMDPRRLF
jgi:catechol 2,3-dioxygenase